MDESFVIASIEGRRVLNSHGDWTFEFEVELSDGRRGRGAAPKGETPSIYERARDARPQSAAAVDPGGFLVGRQLTQVAVDELLRNHLDALGPAHVYALSVACYEAVRGQNLRGSGSAAGGSASESPRVLFNLLNGGLHAYTNPITSDFTEFLVAPRDPSLPAAVDGYRRLRAAARARLSGLPERPVGGNRVADLGRQPNEAALTLMQDLLHDAGLADDFTLMVDASAGDWVTADGYVLPVTGRRMDTNALVEYWLHLIERFGLSLIEDPLGELDVSGWDVLHRARPTGAAILGDNFTSSDPAQLEAKSGDVDAVLLKADQAGTVTRAQEFGRRAKQLGLQLIVSHRSIETDGLFLIHLAAQLGADWVKIGPYSDFSSIMRTNELLRIVER